MIVKILEGSPAFSGIGYNFDKVEAGTAELMKIANFGYLEGLNNARAQDYRNYLLAIAAQNTRVQNTQFHVAISAEGKSFDKNELTVIAEKWLQKMGYHDQPYLIFFHHDTANNHVHLLTSRIDKNGKKIRDSFENVRAVSAMKQLMSQNPDAKIEKALAYRFTTLAQFKMLLRGMGMDDEQIVKDLPLETIKFNLPDQKRRKQLKAIFARYPSQNLLRKKFGIELIFHSKNDWAPYGYTVIDHAQKNVYKGSQIMVIKDFLAARDAFERSLAAEQPKETDTELSSSVAIEQPSDLTHLLNINIADDIDDEAVLGMKRQRKGKARTNLR